MSKRNYSNYVRKHSSGDLDPRRAASAAKRTTKESAKLLKAVKKGNDEPTRQLLRAFSKISVERRTTQDKKISELINDPSFQPVSQLFNIDAFDYGTMFIDLRNEIIKFILFIDTDENKDKTMDELLQPYKEFQELQRQNDEIRKAGVTKSIENRYDTRTDISTREELPKVSRQYQSYNPIEDDPDVLLREGASKNDCKTLYQSAPWLLKDSIGDFVESIHIRPAGSNADGWKPAGVNFFKLLCFHKHSFKNPDILVIHECTDATCMCNQKQDTDFIKTLNVKYTITNRITRATREIFYSRSVFDQERDYFDNMHRHDFEQLIATFVKQPFSTVNPKEIESIVDFYLKQNTDYLKKIINDAFDIERRAKCKSKFESQFNKLETDVLSSYLTEDKCDDVTSIYNYFSLVSKIAPYVDNHHFQQLIKSKNVILNSSINEKIGSDDPDQILHFKDFEQTTLQQLCQSFYRMKNRTMKHFIDTTTQPTHKRSRSAVIEPFSGNVDKPIDINPKPIDIINPKPIDNPKSINLKFIDPKPIDILHPATQSIISHQRRLSNPDDDYSYPFVPIEPVDSPVPIVDIKLFNIRYYIMLAIEKSKKIYNMAFTDDIDIDNDNDIDEHAVAVDNTDVNDDDDINDSNSDDSSINTDKDDDYNDSAKTKGISNKSKLTCAMCKQSINTMYKTVHIPKKGDPQIVKYCSSECMDTF